MTVSHAKEGLSHCWWNCKICETALESSVTILWRYEQNESFAKSGVSSIQISIGIILSLNRFICIVSACVCSVMASNIYYGKICESSEKIYMSVVYKCK